MEIIFAGGEVRDFSLILDFLFYALFIRNAFFLNFWNKFLDSSGAGRGFISSGFNFLVFPKFMKELYYIKKVEVKKFLILETISLKVGLLLLERGLSSLECLTFFLLGLSNSLWM